MKNAKVILGPHVDQAMQGMIDYVDVGDIPNLLTFFETIQTRLIKTLSTLPEGGAPFQGPTRMMVIEGYVFLYDYIQELNEVHVHEMYAPGQNWR